MEHKIHYMGLPAYIDMEEKTIRGRNWWQNILVILAVFYDKTIARIKGETKPKHHITIDEE